MVKTKTFILAIIFGLLPTIAKAQLTAAPDGTNTSVTTNGNSIDITGGSLSNDSANLFHSFSEFNVDINQTANFISQPSIQNILGRVTGGNASLINGLIRVSGGNSNLYLMNPAGIIFGRNASLNVPASFTATTATKITFDNSFGFDSYSVNNYADLVGNPSNFVFDVSQPGSIINAGSLEVPIGKDLLLLSGNVVNTGTLKTSVGRISIVAVPGSSLVRISQAGHLLSLEIDSKAITDSGINPLSLPELLTGKAQNLDIGITVDNSGSIRLTDSEVNVPSGDAVAIASGLIDVFGSDGGKVNILGSKVGLINSNINASGTVFGGDVFIGRDYQSQGAVPNALHTFIDNKSVINVDSLLSERGGQVTIWADKITRFDGSISARGGSYYGDGGLVEISGKEKLSFLGNVDLTATNGNLGILVLDSLDLNIVNSSSIKVSSDNQILISDNTSAISIIDKTSIEKLSANILLEATKNINIQNGVSLNFVSGGSITFTSDADNNNIGSFLMDQTQSITAPSKDIFILGTNITTGNINTHIVKGRAGNVHLLAQKSILTRAIDTWVNGGSGGDIYLNIDSNGVISTGNLNSVTYETYNTDFGGNININSNGGNVRTGSINSYAKRSNSGIFAKGGDILINGSNIITGEINDNALSQFDISFAPGGIISFNATNSISTGDIFNENNIISFISQSGEITTGNLTSNGGKISLSSNKNVTAGNINTHVVNGRGGNVSLSAQYSILTGAIDTWVNGGSGGNINLNTDSNGVISIGNLNSVTYEGDFGGDVNINANGGSVRTGSINSYANLSNGQGGDIIISASNIITDGINDNGLSGFGSLDAPGGIISFNATNKISTGNIFNKNNTINFISQSGEITTEDITSHGGNISLSSNNNLTTGNISSVSNTNNSGNIFLTSVAGAITTGDIYSNNLFSHGGTVNIQAIDRINTGIINTSSETGNGGSVLLDPNNGILVKYINAQGGNLGIGGDVNISTKTNFQATDTFRSRNGLNASISTLGGKESGAIVINHGGEVFAVGNPTTNGTQGSIVAEQSNYLVANRNIVGNLTQGKIQVTSSQDSRASEEINKSDQGQEDTGISLPNNNPTQPQKLVEQGIDQSESINTRQFASFLGIKGNLTALKTEESQVILKRNEALTGVKSAIIYVSFAPKHNVIRNGSLVDTIQNEDILHLGLVTGNSLPRNISVPDAIREKVIAEFQNLKRQVTDPGKTTTTSYLKSSQKIYQWLIAPQEAELQKQGINNLIFVMDEGLRSLPVAVLHDGKQFLVEKYSLGIMPSFSLTNTTYQNVKDAPLLAMGAEKFTPDQKQQELRAVPLEINIINRKMRGGQYLLNDKFTLTNLKAQSANTNYKIIHIATHADFPNKKNGGKKESYIQLYDSKLHYEQIGQIGWNKSPVSLLVLSACKTAIGDEEAEMGFVGLAIKSGVDSALASLWYTSDAGTLGLMTEFYSHLKTANTKTAALQQAQLAMIQGKIRIEGNQLITSTSSIPLSPEEAEYLNNNIVGNLSHPYYWASFTMIGSPW